MTLSSLVVQMLFICYFYFYVLSSVGLTCKDYANNANGAFVVNGPYGIKISDAFSDSVSIDERLTATSSNGNVNRASSYLGIRGDGDEDRFIDGNEILLLSISDIGTTYIEFNIAIWTSSGYTLNISYIDCSGNLQSFINTQQMWDIRYSTGNTSQSINNITIQALSGGVGISYITYNTISWSDTRNPTYHPTKNPTASSSTSNTLSIMSNKDNSNDDIGLIVGVVPIGVLIFVLTIFFVWRKLKNKEEKLDEEIYKTNKTTQNIGIADDDGSANYNNIKPSAPEAPDNIDCIDKLDVSSKEGVMNENGNHDTLNNKIGESQTFFRGNEGANNMKFDVEQWFRNDVDLEQYYIDLLIDHGFDNIKSLKQMTNDDMIEIGITKLGHRKLILSLVQNLQY